MNWYEIQNIDEIDSPALLFYPDHIRHNINLMIERVGGDPKRLIPHVKTYKNAEIIKMQQFKGIRRFKCATITELDMTLRAGADFVLMAYQLVGPKIDRFLQIAQRFPQQKAASLVDNLASAQALASKFANKGMTANVFIDINNGMNRTGFPISGNVIEFWNALQQIQYLNVMGFHVYDGHIRYSNVEDRKAKSDEDFKPVYALLEQLYANGEKHIEVISGGSPTFIPASLRENVTCSPGTTLLWDWNYAKLVPEVDFKWAALLLTRVISKPSPGIVTLDLGHKSVGSENPLDKRIFFLNLENYQPIGQSEEHLVLKVDNWDAIQVGDVLYGVPYHVCPSVALYDEARIIDKNRFLETWSILARKKQ